MPNTSAHLKDWEGNLGCGEAMNQKHNGEASQQEKSLKKKINNVHGGPYEPSGYVRSGVPRGVPRYEP